MNDMSFSERKIRSRYKTITTEDEYTVALAIAHIDAARAEDHGLEFDPSPIFAGCDPEIMIEYWAARDEARAAAKPVESVELPPAIEMIPIEMRIGRSGMY